MPSKETVEQAVTTTGSSGPLSQEEQQEWDTAKYSAALIKEAMLRIEHTDQLSNYERRVALREIKEYVREALEDMGAEPSNEDVKKYLKSNENDETTKQLVVMKKQMEELVNMSNALSKGILEMCRLLKNLWEKHDYTPGDLLEVRIRGTPEKIPTTPLAAATIQNLLDVWTRYEDAVFLGDTYYKEQEERYKTILMGCGMPDHLIPIAIGEVPPGGPSMEARAERVSCALEELGTLQRRINALGRMPSEPRNALEYAEFEDWITQAERLLPVCKAWELTTGIPIYVPLGPAFFLAGVESGVVDPVEDKDTPFVDMLSKALKKVKQVDTGC